MLTKAYHSKLRELSTQVSLNSEFFGNYQKASLKGGYSNQDSRWFVKSRSSSQNLNFQDFWGFRTNSDQSHLSKEFNSMFHIQYQNCHYWNKFQCIWISRWLQYTEPQIIPTNMYVSKQILSQIDKDILRTQNIQNHIQSTQLAKILRDTLIAYCQYDPQVNYVQGFNQLISQIIIHSHNMEHTLRIFIFLMKERKFRKLYINNLQNIKIYAKKISKYISQKCYQLYQHLVIKLGINLEMFLIGWIIPLFTNMVNSSQIPFIIDCLIRRGLSFLYTFSLSILLYFKQTLLQIDNPDDILITLSVSSIRQFNINWKSIIFTALKLPMETKKCLKFNQNTNSRLSKIQF